jgi:starch-binding outer membrane protein, SusD/RagB family
MLTMKKPQSGSSSRLGLLKRSATAALGAVLLVAMAACDGLLDVDLPGTVEAESLDNPALAQTLLNSALGQFECAYTSYVATTGILSGEYRNASSWLNVNTWGWRGLELNSITGSCPTGRDATGLGAYTPLQQARYVAEESTRLIEGFSEDDVPDRSDLLGHLAAYGGFSYVLMGEGYCEMAIDQGPLLTRDQVMETAEERFTSAISHAEAAGNTELRTLATAARARARLNLGDLSGAASDAEQVPQGFAWYAEYSTVNGRRENRLYNLNHRNRVLSVEPDEFYAVMAGDEPDPRVPVADAQQFGHDGVTPHYYQEKYPEADADIPMASWEEAQLILAEARLDQAEDIINNLRAAQGIPALELSGDENMLDVVIEERRRQLFSEGHRLNDKLRHDIPFPTGTNHKGQAWGPITCMPLPDQERQNNPNISG